MLIEASFDVTIDALDAVKLLDRAGDSSVDIFLPSSRIEKQR